METILNIGVSWILALQGLGTWLAPVMKFFSFLGTEEFFLLLLPALYWCVDAGLGLRVGVMLLLNSGLNDALKLAFHGPRPYWYSGQVKAYAAETSFGAPSGHAQGAVGVWGMIASQMRRRWAWPVAILIMFLIGLSRLYLGVHFPHDVILGWLFGALALWLVLYVWERTAAWLKKQSLGKQILLAFEASLLIILVGLIPFFWLVTTHWQPPQAWAEFASEAVTLSGVITSGGTFFGLAVGVAWLATQGGFDARGPFLKRLARFLLGLVGVLIIYLGLKMVFPSGEAWLPYILRYVRYALLGAWVSAGAPWLFIRLKLAEKKS